MTRTSLRIVGARENNLKNVSAELPHDDLIVLTGLSGSGKSSLAFETVYAEGQRRYVETFSPYTRQFFDKVKKPDVDLVEHVRPAIAIQQRTRVTGSRSTVGSMTNINDYLKVLWSNVATPVCPSCDKPLRAWTSRELALHLIAQNAESTSDQVHYICARYQVQNIKKHFASEIERLATLGFSRVFDEKSGTVAPLEEFAAQHGPQPTLLLALDRFRGESTPRKRLIDSIEQAFSVGNGRCVVLTAEASGTLQREEFLNHFACPTCDFKLPKPRPALFSYNHPIGACPECRGFGRVLEIDRAQCVPDTRLSIREQALQCWNNDRGRGEYRRLLKFCAAHEIPTEIPWRALAPEQQELIFTHRSREFTGVLPWFERLERKAYKMHVRVFLARYRAQVDCPTCKGTRLRPEALAFRVDGRTLADVWRTPIAELTSWITTLIERLESQGALPRQLKDVFDALGSRLRYLVDLGLPYLTLDRQTRTLSGGETQRVNLAGALGSELISTHFVLDEPSVGLHPRDTERLIKAVRTLQQRGNSVLLVEHDLECIAEADQLIELGPKAGAEGGEITFQGPIKDWRGITIPEAPPRLPVLPEDPALHIRRATARNLKGFSVRLPLHRMVCLTGVSGSGKSSLVSEVLLRGWRRYTQGEPLEQENVVEGFEQITQALLVDQSPLAKSPRANIATYSGIWEHVRMLLANTDEAKQRNLTKSSFSFNVDGGRCTACSGAGFIREDMQFLSDVYIPCEQCLGRRFMGPVLEVQYRGKSVDEFLRMSVDECATFFHGHPQIGPAAETLSLLGLGHLTLGHPLSELSGGEAQRLKLVPFVEQSARGSSLLIFDEPTTGLHVQDVARLIELCRLLVSRGHSVLCIEHNLQLIRASDWIIDLGPEGGEGGGEVIAQGTPSELQASKGRSYTAAFLAKKEGESRRRPRSTGMQSRAARTLSIVGAREHNLKNVSVTVPLDKVVAFTGVSGSGKSTIAKDIIYAEGQRRYLDCLSPYARQYIKELHKPEYDRLEGVQPTICVYQHTFQPSHLSTVGTMSEVYNFLRLLYAKLGTQYCPEHPQHQISPLSSQEIAQRIKEIEGGPVRLLAPIIKLKKGLHKPVFTRAIESEIFEVRVDGRLSHPSRFEEGLEKNKQHTIEFVTAKFTPVNLSLDLLNEAVQHTLMLGGGSMIVLHNDREQVFSSERTCPECKTGFFKPDPEDLSFHSRRGRCPECDGYGCFEDGELCETCGGSRLGPVGRNLRLNGKSIHEASSLVPSALRAFLTSLSLSPREERLAAPVLTELLARIDTLVSFGLDYIELDRDCHTLSGGELQRLRLATAIGSPLTGVMYIFDEPSVGLHPLDNLKVLSRIRGLRDRGNSVLMIEHDPQSILACDHVIEVGPGGGRDGGTIVYDGPIESVARAEHSLTGRALLPPTAPDTGATPQPSGTITVEHGSCNNIEDLSLSLPLGTLVTFAGVSGAGKSSLVRGIVVETLTEGRAKKGNVVQYGDTVIRSTLAIDRVLEVSQQPIGANSRSTPASYLGVWDEVRKLFATTVEARARGWSPSHFSYNTGKGRCPECKGLGEITLEMNFLPDAQVTCETCNGRRFSDETNLVTYLGYSISQVLALTFEEAKGVFANHPKIYRALHTACELGLGYLTLGQSSKTLSGGESQRLKLVYELSSKPKGHTLYVLDEPTTGLHRADVARLLKILRELVALGHSVFVIEHDPDVLLASDHVVELGPGPAAQGGKVLFEGHPADLLHCATPWGRVLRELLEKPIDRSSLAPTRSTEQRAS